MHKPFARYQHLRTPILAPLAVALLALFAVFLIGASMMQDQRIRQTALSDIESSQRLYDTRLQRNVDQLAIAMKALLQDPHLINRLKMRDHHGLLAMSEAFFKDLKQNYQITHMYFSDAQRINVLRAHNPAQWGDVINRPSTLKAEKSDQLAWAVEPGIFGTLTLRVVLPVNLDGQRIGYLELGREIDYLLPEISQLFQLDISVVIYKPLLKREDWESSMHSLGFPADWERFPSVVMGAHQGKTLPPHVDAYLKNLQFSPPSLANSADLTPNDIEQAHSVFTAKPLYDGAGRLIGQMLFIKDIGHQHNDKQRFLINAALAAAGIALALFSLLYVITGRVEREIRHLNHRNRLILEAADQGIIGIDLQGKIHFSNPAASRILGYSANELLGHGYQDRLHAVAMTGEETTIATDSIALTLRDGSVQHREQTIHCHRDQGFVPVELISAPIYEDGRQVGAVLTLLDISQRLNQQRRIRESDLHMRAIVDNATDGIVTVDGRGHILTINPAAQRLFGYDAEAIKNQTLSSLVPDFLPELFDHYLYGGENLIIGSPQEMTGKRQDGSFFPIRMSVSEIHLPDSHQFMSLIQDITLQKRAEHTIISHSKALERSNQELQNFAYVASHDLQEPLRKIMAFGDRLANQYGDQLDDKGRDYLTRMRNAADRMRLLISSLLSYSRVESKAKPWQAVDLRAVLVDVLSDLESRITDTGAEIVYDKLPTIEADAVQMHQLLQNLIGNGLKFRRAGVAPRVEVHYRLLARNDVESLRNIDVDQTCLIEIKDNGIGFDNKYLDRIFNIFQRLHSQEQYEGSGIGLAICRKIAERHQGTLDANGEPDVGATFILKLPMRPPPVATSTQEFDPVVSKA